MTTVTKEAPKVQGTKGKVKGVAKNARTVINKEKAEDSVAVMERARRDQKKKWEKELTTITRQFKTAWWMLAEKIVEGEEKEYITRGKYDEVADITGLAKSSLASYVSTFRNATEGGITLDHFIDSGLTYNHLAAAAKAQPEQRKDMVIKAKKEELSPKAIRSIVKGPEPERKEPEKESDQLVETMKEVNALTKKLNRELQDYFNPPKNISKVRRVMIHKAAGEIDRYEQLVENLGVLTKFLTESNKKLQEQPKSTPKGKKKAEKQVA